MGQLLSSGEERSQAMDLIGSLLYDAMLEGGAVPDLSVVNPLLSTNQVESSDSRDRLQKHLQQLQSDIGSRAPSYLKDLIGRLSSFSDEPRLAGLLGLAVTMVMDMAYASSKPPAGGKGTKTESGQQTVCELQDVMEEFLKRCRINAEDKHRLIEDCTRLEAKLSLSLTRLKRCMLGGDCDSRSVRIWTSGAVFHTHMLVHRDQLEGRVQSPAARATLEQYREDLKHIIPAYRRFKAHTVCVVKCHGRLLESCDCDSDPEDGSMTGLTVMDRETGRSVSVSLSSIQKATGSLSGPGTSSSSSSSSSINLDLITSDQFSEAYLDLLFSNKGPVAQLEEILIRTSDQLNTTRTGPEPDQEEPREPRDQREPREQEQRDQRERRDQREPREPREQRDQRERRDQREQEQRDQRERRDQREQEQRDQRERREPREQEQREQRDRRDQRGRDGGEETEEDEQRDEGLQLSIAETLQETDRHDGQSPNEETLN